MDNSLNYLFYQLGDMVMVGLTNVNHNKYSLSIDGNSSIILILSVKSNE